MKDTDAYVLRHARPLDGDLPNRARPLSEQGRAAARALVGYLKGLGVEVVYSSPFQRTLETVEPFCRATGTALAVREDLGESAADEPFEEVRARMVRAVTAIVRAHPGRKILVCTHGGTLWALLSHFNPKFGYDAYRRIGCPDMRRIVYAGTEGRLDTAFQFNVPMV